MKTFTLMFTVVLIALNAYSQANKTIDFNSTFDIAEIKKKASAENKIIFIDVAATWCAPCKKMEQSVYTDDAVRDYYNKNFICLKIQIDTNKNDNEEQQKMYLTASRIKTKYNITGVPSFLFLNSDGDLVHRDQGYFPVKDFITLGETAKDSSQNLQGLWQQYQRGSLNGIPLLKFAIYLRRIRYDSTSLVAAEKFKNTYLEKQDDMDYQNIRMSNVLPMFQFFFSLIKVNDLFIKYIYKNQDKVDQDLKMPGFSKSIVLTLITRDIIDPSLKKSEDEKTAPNWSSLQDEIQSKWGNDIAYQSILERKIQWHYTQKNWNKAASYQIERTEKYGIPPNINNLFWEIFFIHCDDKNLLKRAATYMAADIKKNQQDYMHIDTYAGILYKSGQTEEAIKMEKKACELVDAANDQKLLKIFKERVEKMRNGIPTWLD